MTLQKTLITCSFFMGLIAGCGSEKQIDSKILSCTEDTIAMEAGVIFKGDGLEEGPKEGLDQTGDDCFNN